MWTARMLIGVSIVLAPPGVAQAQDVAAPSAPPPVHSSVVGSGPTSSTHYAPPQAAKYRLAGTHVFPDGSGVEFTYQNGTDSGSVVASPYDSGQAPRTREDTDAVVQREVLRVREPLELAAQRQQLENYYLVGDRAENLHIGAATIHYYWYFAMVRQRGAQGHYLYYAVYAMPDGLVRVRAEIPWTVAAPQNSGGARYLPGTPAGGGVTLGSAGVGEANPAPYHEQLAAFANDVISGMATHSAHTAAAPTAVASTSATVMPAVCATTPPAGDTINYRVYARLDAPASKDSLPAGYVELVLDALRHSLVVPNPLGLTVYAEMISVQGGMMVPAVFGEIDFTLDDQGKVSDIHLTQSSLSPALDQSFFDAPRRADSAQAFPGQIGVTNPGKIRFYVAFSPFESRQGRSMPFFAVRMPAWRPGARPAIDPTRDLKPTFPVDAHNAPGGDSVSIQFVVDDHGAPVKSTMRLLSANYIEYAQAVVDAALHSQYIPAMAAGCPVPGLLERTWRMTVGAQ